MNRVAIAAGATHAVRVNIIAPEKTILFIENVKVNAGGSNIEEFIFGVTSSGVTVKNTYYNEQTISFSWQICEFY